MKQRGRKSAVALATPAAQTVVEPPPAPLELTPEQADVWTEIAGAMPADWFGAETFHLLSQLCRHTIEARRLAQLIDAEVAKREDFNPAIYVEYLKAQQRETASIKALSVTMRLAQQSRYGARGADTASRKGKGAPPPWQG